MKSIKRRDFLKGTLAASAIGAAPFNILKAGPSPNSKLNIAGQCRLSDQEQQCYCPVRC